MKVGFQFPQTRSRTLQFGVRNADLAPGPSGTPAIDERQYVGLAPDLALDVHLDAPSQLHPAVQRPLDEYHVHRDVIVVVVPGGGTTGVGRCGGRVRRVR